MVYAQYNNKCAKCGNPYSYLEIHHIIPRYRGGSDDLDNLIPLCWECHTYAPDDPSDFNEYVKVKLLPRFAFATPLMLYTCDYISGLPESDIEYLKKVGGVKFYVERLHNQMPYMQKMFFECIEQRAKREKELGAMK